MKETAKYTLGSSANDSLGNPLFPSRHKKPLAAHDHHWGGYHLILLVMN